MAKLSAHGIEVGRIEFATKNMAWFSDGKVLENRGFGWKISGKIKAGFTPESAYRTTLEKQKEFLDARPMRAEYTKLLLEIPLSIRWKVLSALDLMGDDIDGVWSTLDDDYDTRGRFALEDIQELLAANKAAAQEFRDLKEVVI